MNTHSRGFTLIELLVVIAIIGILSSVVLASLNSARVKGRDARRVSDIKQIQLALELYYDNQQSYPAMAAGSASSTLGALVTSNFISSIPSDPSQVGANGYRYASTDLAGAACTSAPCPSYIVRALMEGTVPAGGYTGSGAINCSTANEYCMRP